MIRRTWRSNSLTFCRRVFLAAFHNLSSRRCLHKVHNGGIELLRPLIPACPTASRPPMSSETWRLRVSVDRNSHSQRMTGGRLSAFSSVDLLLPASAPRPSPLRGLQDCCHLCRRCISRVTHRWRNIPTHTMPHVDLLYSEEAAPPVLLHHLRQPGSTAHLERLHQYHPRQNLDGLEIFASFIVCFRVLPDPAKREHPSGRKNW